MDDLYTKKLDMLIGILEGDVKSRLDECKKLEEDIKEFQERIIGLKQEVDSIRDLKKDLKYLRGSNANEVF